MSHRSDIYDVLKRYWGYDQFRPGQEEAITSVLDGRDVFVLFPTGGGKSICYQVPALLSEGVCVVISPLIALMQDQVHQLRKLGIKAEYLHGGLSYFDIDRILDNAVYGDVKLLYMAPERLSSQMTIERLQQMQLSFIAVDEAHCISQWGHDFRPSYREINQIRELCPDITIMALTASATHNVIEDIKKQLLLRDPLFITTSYLREELTYVVRNEEQKLDFLLTAIKRIAGSVILYVRSRSKTEHMAKELTKSGLSAAAYHAGMSYDQRSAIMQAWMKGDIRICCATNAFGMGVDKADVRLVVHLDLPPSLEEYYQEAGRAGRDKQKSYCLLLYNQADILRLESNLKLAFPPIDDIKHVYTCLAYHYNLATGSGQGESFEFDLQSFIETYHLGYQSTGHILKILCDSGWIELTESYYQPSKVMIVVDRRDLYDYQLKNQLADIFLKTILRTYEGLFSQFTPISELYLAKKLSTDEKTIRAMLDQLDADDIIDFEPQSDSPKIHFLRPRSTDKNFNIDRAKYDLNKKLASQRAQSVLDYIHEKTCRTKNILHYFDVELNHNCGRCDLCLEKDEVPDEATYIKFKSIVLKNMGELTTIASMLRNFPANRSKQVEHVLKRMVDEKWIILENGDIHLHPSKKKSP